ncbi:MAG: HAD family hydrolase [Clostridia bacterium]|nr:HAD family hydrolase [Clostridia bacterium]
MEIFDREAAARKRKLLIFDFDGTIADTIGTIVDAVNLTMDACGYPRRTREEIRRAIGHSSLYLIRCCMPEELSGDAALVDRVHEIYKSFYAQTCVTCKECYDGFSESVCALKEKGYLIAVLSNKLDVFIQDMVRAVLPEGLVSVAMGKTELPAKPDPTAPLLIASRLGISPEHTAYIGDSEVDVQTGLNGGMLAVGCSWGYRPRDLLISTGAHVVLDDPRDLLNLFG